MKNILLPTDFSDNSWTAIVYALKLYSDKDCTFYVLNSSELKVTTTLNLSKKLVETLHKNDKAQLLKFKERIESSYPNPNHEVKVLLSSEALSEAIDTAIATHKIDMVVMGTKGATGLKAFVLGSNTVRIINKIIKCPILVIPENYNFIAPKQIAFPTDYSRFYAHKELRPIQDFADLWDSKIRVLYIAEKSSLTKEQKINKAVLKEHFAHNKTGFHWVLKCLKITNEITSFVEDYKVDLLAMVKYKHSYFEKILREPIIKKIGFHITVPFLVIPK
ncbi:universal stress protein [Lacinutrix sp. Bg11-31]|uniref:universal stress protein n=1 Tax=Lacinutrix sp. Bg11-31 TaxID=2057808 RepID=UPI000C316B6F|nr:universal stress protein [Lacinutrix sp. Bg11-31]AUC81129.1 universal stress protein [Lacinutrix sp. Bg11-31]